VPLLRANQIPTSRRGAGGAASQPRAGGVRAALGAFGGLLVLFAVVLAAAEWLQARVPLASGAELLANGSTSKEQLEQTHAALVRTVRLAPHDSRSWLLLAAAEMRSGGTPDAIAAALKMSYYTGPNEASLIPLRLGLAASPNLAGDADLKTLLETEMLTVVQQPAMRPLLVQAYRQASPDAQRRLLETVTTVNAELAAEMQAAASKP
jgi:hypothetical protein